MRLATIQTDKGPRAAVLHNNSYVDLNATDPALPSSIRQLLEAGVDALAAAAERARAQTLCGSTRLSKAAAAGTRPKEDRLPWAQLPRPRGRDRRQIPKEPVLFSKYATALVGHEDDIVLPSVSQEVDYEAELVIVVGKRGRHLLPTTLFITSPATRSDTTSRPATGN